MNQTDSLRELYRLCSNRGEVVCWIIFLGSFLCFLSRDRSGGQGSPTSAATRTQTDATLRCPFPSFRYNVYC
ncbi:unnamed protein product [Pleuronectes platessa]|uniref:Uncharacterized protein n=1 Tax=Pleuronectes platessa TaxID=8262 RepID=A0A9N7VK97_PLEPL|nr:unnamed protein product [Pleuronectes platessa]